MKAATLGIIIKWISPPSHVEGGGRLTTNNQQPPSPPHHHKSTRTVDDADDEDDEYDGTTGARDTDVSRAQVSFFLFFFLFYFTNVFLLN
jgi:hypothetical protein